jgi:hypothetical protein
MDIYAQIVPAAQPAALDRLSGFVTNDHDQPEQSLQTTENLVELVGLELFSYIDKA